MKLLSASELHGIRGRTSNLYYKQTSRTTRH